MSNNKIDENTDEWNIVISDKRLDKLQDDINQLQTENTNLKIELNTIKQQLENSNMFMNKNYLYSYAETDTKLPFHLQYENRFNKVYLPNYNVFQPETVNIPLYSLKEEYQEQPLKSLLNISNYV